jgi:glycerol uptake facilitator-like aquaporin
VWHRRQFIGELLGTFLLVLFGCGAVAVSVLFGAHSGLFQVAMAWGIGVTLAIYATRHLSCAHLNPAVSLAPVFIGLTVTSIICLIAPLKQAGLNPARDLGPRLFSWLAGWGVAAFPDDRGGFLWVYVLGPVCGGALASLLFVRVIEPAMGPEPVSACGAGDSGSSCVVWEDARGDGNAR